MTEKRPLRKPKCVMVTGGAGFIGSNLIRHIFAERPEWFVVSYDLLTYAGSLFWEEESFPRDRHAFVLGDICDPSGVLAAIREYGVDLIINCAAQSHVDNAIAGSAEFLRTNFSGTGVLLDAARVGRVPFFLQLSTDEVYGESQGEIPFGEGAPLCPNNPYSASKAAADLLCRSYSRTYGQQIAIVRPCNNYGPRQHPEKLIPKFILKSLKGQPLPLYGDGSQKRCWLNVDDTASALIALAQSGEAGEIYNLGSPWEFSNLEIAKKLLQITGREESLISKVADRPGHDRRYLMDSSKITAATGWRPSVDPENGLYNTVLWYGEKLPEIEKKIDLSSL